MIRLNIYCKTRKNIQFSRKSTFSKYPLFQKKSIFSKYSLFQKIHLLKYLLYIIRIFHMHVQMTKYLRVGLQYRIKRNLRVHDSNQSLEFAIWFQDSLHGTIDNAKMSNDELKILLWCLVGKSKCINQAGYKIQQIKMHLLSRVISSRIYLVSHSFSR